MATFIDYCKNGNIEGIKQISLKDCNLEDGFMKACAHGHHKIVQYLVELHKNDSTYNPIDIYANDEEGFKMACEKGAYDIANYLLKLTKKNKFGYSKPFNNYLMALKNLKNICYSY